MFTILVTTAGLDVDPLFQLYFICVWLNIHNHIIFFGFLKQFKLFGILFVLDELYEFKYVMFCALLVIELGYYISIFTNTTFRTVGILKFIL